MVVVVVVVVVVRDVLVRNPVEEACCEPSWLCVLCFRQDAFLSFLRTDVLLLRPLLSLRFLRGKSTHLSSSLRTMQRGHGRSFPQAVFRGGEGS